MKEDNGNDTPQPHKPFLVPMGSGLGAWAALGGRLPRSHSRQPTRNANGTGFGGADRLEGYVEKALRVPAHSRNAMAL